MRILIISNLYPPYVLGGYEILCHQVVNALEGRGHSIEVLTSDHGSPVSEKNVTRTLRLYRPFDQKAGFERFARAETARSNYRITEAYLSKREYDVIFIWSLLRLTPSAALVAERSGIPVVYTFNDENIAGFAPHPFSLRPKQLVHWILDAMMPMITTRPLRLEHTTCISNITRKNIIDKGVPIEGCRVIYQGIPTESFPRKQEPYGTLHSPIRLLYTGQLHHYKGVHTILEALSLLPPEVAQRLSITIAGAGESEYEKRLEDLGKLAACPVTFTGKIPHQKMSDLYRSHDLFVFPSIWQEPFGLTHLEAMASGLPVISTANGGQGEFLIDRENALVFEPGDPKSLAEALVTMIEDDQLRKRIARNGRETAIGQFSFERYVLELEELLKSVSR